MLFKSNARILQPLLHGEAQKPARAARVSESLAGQNFLEHRLNSALINTGDVQNVTLTPRRADS